MYQQRESGPSLDVKVQEVISGLRKLKTKIHNKKCHRNSRKVPLALLFNKNIYVWK
jgi:hypothetical protein